MLPAQAARCAAGCSKEPPSGTRRPDPRLVRPRRPGPPRTAAARDEERHYRNLNEAHRQHFEAMDVPLGSVGVAASARPEVLDGLAP